MPIRPSLTRQHFEAIAESIARTPGLTAAQREDIAERMVSALYPFNHNVKRDRFIRAATNTPPWVHTAEANGATASDPFPTLPAEATSPFTAVGGGTYDAGSDRLTVHASADAINAAMDAGARYAGTYDAASQD